MAIGIVIALLLVKKKKKKTKVVQILPSKTTGLTKMPMAASQEFMPAGGDEWDGPEIILDDFPTVDEVNLETIQVMEM